MRDDNPVNDVSHYSKKLFEVLNVIPADQVLVTAAPETSVRDALGLLDRHGFSQLPVVNGRKVLGVFSHRSYARAIVTHAKAAGSKAFDPLGLSVADCMAEVPRFARVTDLFQHWFEDLDRNDCLIIGDPDRLQAIVTPTDVFRYLYEVASPYVLIAECELSLRAIIHVLMREDTLDSCARQCLAYKYTATRIPVRLEDMTIDDYIHIVTDGRWSHFEPVFGVNRDTTRQRLEKLRDLRNELYHHRGDASPDEHRELAGDRAWLRAKLDIAQALPPSGTGDVA